VGAVALAIGLGLAAYRWGRPGDDGCATTSAFLQSHREAELRAVGRGAAWLQALPVDPVVLRSQGQKGKKHFVEALDALVRLHLVAPEAEKPALLEQIRKLTAVTNEDAYHDMITNEDLAFKQDATSYLRAALLMERVGLDTKRYRAEIHRIEPRLNAHLKTRGVHQRMAFAWYYRYFGLAEHVQLQGAFKRGIISQRVDPRTMTKAQAYELTHEIFVPYEYGDALEATPFTLEEKSYLAEALPLLIDHRIARNDPDLVAELVACMRMLRFTGLGAYLRGLQFLLETQRPDGAWGHYEQYREKLGDLVDQAYVLHTTEVVLDALTLAFHPPWNSAPEVWCVKVREPTAQPRGPAAEKEEEPPLDEP
jgi:hypothetical protein